MPNRWTAALAVAVVVAIPAARACADGCFVWHGGADLYEPTQKALIHWADGRETLLLQVRYEGSAEDFAWIVPLPAKPDVKAIDADKSPFAEISEFTQRRQRYQIEGSRGKDGAAAVTVLERKVVGVYDVAILAASDAKALGAWLARHGFSFPADRGDVLAHYTRKGWVYAAMRIDPKQLASDEVKKLKTGMLQPIRFVFDAKEMVYPLHISSVNAGETEVLLYLLADAPMVLASGPARPGLEPDVIVPRYHMEWACDPTYTTPPAVTGDALPLTWEAMGLAKDARRHLVKYRATYTGDRMTDDLAFKPFEPRPYWQARLRAAKNPWEKQQVLRFLVLLDPAYREPLEAAGREIQAEIKRRRAEELRSRQDVLRKKARSADPEVRASALDADEAPLDVLMLLANDPEVSVRRRLATCRVTFPEVLARLARDADAEVRRAVAGRREATPEVIRLLIEDAEPAVRVAAAHHPHAPPDARAGVIARDGDTQTRRRCAADSKEALRLLALLARDADPAVRKAAAANEATPLEAFLALAKDEDAEVRRTVAGRGRTPADVRAALARDAAPRVREAAARWRLPEDVQHALATDEYVPLRRALALNPTVAPEVVRVLARDGDVQVRAACAYHPNAPSDVREALATDQADRVRECLASNRAIPEALMRKLACDATTNVRACLALNTAVPLDLLTALAADEEGAVRCGVARNPLAPADLLERLATDPLVDVKRAVACHPNVPPGALRGLARHLHASGLAELVAKNTKTPPDALRALARAPAWNVRWSVAGNPGTPEDVLRTLAGDEHTDVARHAREVLGRRGLAAP